MLFRSAHDLNALIDRSLRLVRHELNQRGVNIAREFAEHLSPLRVDRIQIEQVFVNLFINASHAMPNGGQLTVRTYAGENESIAAEVLDTGTGISEQDLPKIFDPFFTTKPVGIGTGMGLPVARGIIAQHGGELKLANRPEGGACAVITFHKPKETPNGS